jgi:hypothetical protein
MCTAGMVLALVVGCDDPGPRQAPTGPPRTTTSDAPASPAPSATSPAAPATAPTTTPAALPRFDAAAAQRTVGYLAGTVGPREATSAAYRQAAHWVQQRFTAHGYEVTRQPLRVPAGVSWGVPVDAGETWNVVARPAGLIDGQPFLLVGAHLDTVPQAPGAEDNASGIAVLLELARLAAEQGTRMPVVFVAFAAEEPRGSGDSRHHFGSTAFVRRLEPAQRRALRGMVSLDRVGVGRVVPVCTGGLGTARVRTELARTARRLGIATRTCADNRASDHWSFEKAGLPAARLGSTPYAEYHSARDRPGVVDPTQLQRVGRVAWGWLSAGTAGR